LVRHYPKKTQKYYKFHDIRLDFFKKICIFNLDFLLFSKEIVAVYTMIIKDD